MNKSLKDRVTKPIITISGMFVFQFISAFIGFLQSVNHNGKGNFIYDYTSLFYGVVLSIIWLISSIFVQLITKGKFDNHKFFIGTFEIFMICIAAILFGSFLVSSVASLF